MATKRKAKPMGDLPETIAEVREELAAESHAAPAPQYTSDGVLLNPEHFHVGPDGVLTPKAR